MGTVQPNTKLLAWHQQAPLLTAVGSKLCFLGRAELQIPLFGQQIISYHEFHISNFNENPNKSACPPCVHQLESGIAIVNTCTHFD